MSQIPAVVKGLPLRMTILGLMLLSLPVRAGGVSEYRLKAAVLFNFAVFTEWPSDVGGLLTLCVHGHDPFGSVIDELQGKVIGRRTIDVKRKPVGEALNGCQIVFITSSAMGSLPHVLRGVRGHPVLTVADSAGAARCGVALNLAVEQNKVSFEANVQAARASGLRFSSKLLRLATEVIQ